MVTERTTKQIIEGGIVAYENSTYRAVNSLDDLNSVWVLKKDYKKLEMKIKELEKRIENLEFYTYIE